MLSDPLNRYLACITRTALRLVGAHTAFSGAVDYNAAYEIGLFTAAV